MSERIFRARPSTQPLTYEGQSAVWEVRVLAAKMKAVKYNVRWPKMCLSAHPAGRAYSADSDQVFV